MPFIFHREGKARRTDFVQRKFQDLLCVVTEKECLIFTYLSLVSCNQLDKKQTIEIIIRLKADTLQDVDSRKPINSEKKI